MSLGEDERKIMVEFEIEKAHRLIDQFPILENAKLLSLLCLSKMNFMLNRIKEFPCFSASILSRKASSMWNMDDYLPVWIICERKATTLAFLNN